MSTRTQSVPNRDELVTMIETVLYAKVDERLDEIRLQEAAVILNEADPTPKIWNDEKGNPVVPSPADWARHYEGIAAHHVKAQMDAAKSRWDEAVRKAEEASKRLEAGKTETNVQAVKHAQAEVKNLRMSIGAAAKALRQKNTAAAKFSKVQDKKRKVNHDRIHKIVHGVTHGLLGGSGLANHLAHGIASAVSKHLEKGGANTTNHK